MSVDARRTPEGGDGRKRRNRLMVWSSVAILAIYGAGWARTRAAASMAVAGPQAVIAAAAAPGAASTGSGTSGGATAGSEPPRRGTAGSGAAQGSSGGQAPAPQPRAAAVVPAQRREREGFPKGGHRAEREGGEGRSPSAALRPVSQPASKPAGQAAPQPASKPVGQAVPQPASKPAREATARSAPIPAPQAAPQPAPKAATARTSGYRDGTYAGTGFGFHGPISVDVTIQGGKIVSTRITACGTRYPCSWISALPREVVAQQTVYVNMVSGATASSEAFLGAVAQALSKAK